MKLLHLADLHIGKRVYEYSMLEEQKQALSQALSMAEEHAVDAVLIAGDVYDKSVPVIEGVKLLDTFLSELKEEKIPVFLISGNHDSAERLAFGRQLFTDAGVYLSGTYEDSVQKVTLTDEYGDVDLYLLPFLKPQQVELLEGEEKPEDYTEAVQLVLNRLEIDKTKRNVLLAHQFVGGGSREPERTDSETQSVGGLDMVDYRVFDDFDYVALGHLHGAQHVGRETVRYAGSPVKYSFSEVRQVKSATLVTLGEKGCEVVIEKLPFTPVHDMREIRGTLRQLTNAELLAETDVQDYMHITLTDEEEIYDVLGKLRAVYPNMMVLDFDNARTRAEGAAMLAGEAIREKTTMELFREFFEKQTETKLNSTQEQLILDIIEKTE
ncbi:MAG: exonuclease SbcCD subunit D [Lachnospiraceae bacterium]|nr:exonuclease SbcCD subunit D [Lachnospiraceae bacterium]MBP3611217.1 exonuclease SbcCD subunit D [Lachnospiraceae bacterium]